MSRNRSLVFSWMAVFSGFLALHGADITWKGGDATNPYDLATPANWNGGKLPGASDNAVITVSPAQPLTQSIASLITYRPNLKGATIDFDLGKGNAFYASDRMFFGENNVDQVVTLKSGILGVDPDTTGDGRIFISDNATGSRTVIVDGPDSIFQGSKKNSIILGQNQPNNTLIVRNGALLRGGVNMGLNSAAAINNHVIVTGEGSRYELPSGYSTGCSVGGGIGNRDNEFMVTNRATFTIANGTQLNIGGYYNGSDVGSGTLTFADQATGTVNSIVYVGLYGSTNRLNVLDGSSFSCSSYLQIGGCRADKVKDGRVSCDNEVRVSGEGSVLTVGDQVYVGRGGGATDSRLIVEKGATVVADKEALHVGHHGTATNSLLEVRSGATYVGGNGYIYIGENAGAVNSQLVVDDATFIFTNQNIRARNAYVGRAAGDSAMIVTNKAKVLFSQKGCWFFVGDYSARGALLSVADGSSMAFRDTGLTIGQSSGVSEAQVVVDNATLSLTNEQAVAAELRLGFDGKCNRLEVRNGALMSLTNCNISVGNTASAVSNVLRVASGSTFFHTRTSDATGNLLAVGYRAPYCRLEVDGARFISSNDCINVGRESTAHHATMDLRNGALVDLHRVIVGHDGSHCTVNIEDSELNVKHSISAGNGQKPGQTNNVWRFSGSRTKVRQTWSGYGAYFNAGTELEFNIPREGLLVQPVLETVGNVSFNVTNSECRITVDPRYANGGRLVLVKANKITIPDGYRFVVSPNAKLDLSVPGEIAIKTKRIGTTVIVR